MSEEQVVKQVLCIIDLMQESTTCVIISWEWLLLNYFSGGTWSDQERNADVGVSETNGHF